MEIHDTGVVVVLAREESLVEFSGVDVSERVVMGVPSPEAQIEATNGRKMVVHSNNLFVMGPELNAVCAES